MILAVLLALVVHHVHGNPLCYEPTVCSPYVSERMCGMSEENAGRWTPNSTHVYIGVMKSLEGWPLYYKQDLDIGTLCALEEIRMNATLMPFAENVDVVFMDDRATESGGISAGLCMQHGGIPFSVGPFGSSMAKGQALIGKVYEGLNTIGTAASSPSLSNKINYPYFSRVFPSDAFQGRLLARLAFEMGFSKVATLATSPDVYYDGMLKEFISEATMLNMTIFSTTVPPKASRAQFESAVNRVIASGFRVLFPAIEQNDAQIGLQVMYEKGLFESGWAFVSPEAFILDFEQYDLRYTNGMIGTVPRPALASPNLLKLEQCVSNHINDTVGMFANMTLQTPNSVWTALWFDAMMVLATALTNVGPDNIIDANIVRDAIRSVKIEGASGHISMDENGDRLGMAYDVVNIVDGQHRLIGHVQTNDMVFRFDDSVTVTYPGGVDVPPIDFEMKCDLDKDYILQLSECAPKRLVTFDAKTLEAKKYCPDIAEISVTCDYALTNSPGFVVAIISLLATLAFLGGLAATWNSDIMKRSQRRFLLAMVCGSLFGCLTPVAIYGEVTRAKCSMGPIMLSFAFVLLLGPLFLKSWRVACILRNNSLSRARVKERTLWIRLVGLLGINAMLCGLLVLFDEPYVGSFVQTIEVENSLRASIPVHVCALKNGKMSMLMLAYLALLLFYGCYISYTIRHGREDLSEAKYLFLSNYNALVWAIITMVITYGLESNTAATEYLFISLGTCAICIITLFLILVPKFINIYYGVDADDLSRNRGGFYFGNAQGDDDTSETKAAPTTSPQFALENENLLLRKYIFELGGDPERFISGSRKPTYAVVPTCVQTTAPHTTTILDTKSST